MAPAVLLLAAGCGASGGDQTPTKADYVQKANKICRDGTRDLVKAGQDIDINDPKKFEKAVTDVYVPAVRKQISRIRDLGYPPGDKAELDAVYTKTEKALDQIEKDPERYRTATTNPFANENKFLKSYGLTACGSQG
jgi:hypothetical protein